MLEVVFGDSAAGSLQQALAGEPREVEQMLFFHEEAFSPEEEARVWEEARLWQQEEEKRVIFLRRYWYFESIDDICRRSGYSRSKVTSMLHQTRKKLRTYLEKEGIEV